MNEKGYIFKICASPEDMKFAESAEMALLEGLGNNIIEHLGNVELGRALKIFIVNPSDDVVGGVIANCFGGWMYISLLWIEKSLRNHGYGTQLVRLAEEDAIRLGCTHAHLDTYSFEARPFYEKLGYELFATLKDYPQGYSKYFLQKQLSK